jgi:DNA-binding transcriptional ArsR family regulator
MTWNQDLSVVARPDQAAALVHPDRARVLAALREPGSATSVARRIGLSRQRVNYHLRELEAVGLVRLVEERRRRNCTERIVQATAARYVVSPDALAELGAEGENTGDRFSSSVLVAMAARIVREVGQLRERARAAGRRLATFSLGAEVRFGSAEDRARFAEELTAAVAELVARYHTDDARGGRRFRLAIGLHPTIEPEGAVRERHGGTGDDDDA